MDDTLKHLFSSLRFLLSLSIYSSIVAKVNHRETDFG